MMIIILVGVISVKLLFIELVMHNMLEAQIVWRVKNNSKWFHQNVYFKIFLKINPEKYIILIHYNK